MIWRFDLEAGKRDHACITNERSWVGDQEEKRVMVVCMYDRTSWTNVSSRVDG